MFVSSRANLDMIRAVSGSKHHKLFLISYDIAVIMPSHMLIGNIATAPALDGANVKSFRFSFEEVGLVIPQNSDSVKLLESKRRFLASNGVEDWDKLDDADIHIYWMSFPEAVRNKIFRNVSPKVAAKNDRTVHWNYLCDRAVQERTVKTSLTMVLALATPPNHKI